MNEATKALQSAREALSRVLGKRRPTTETELDECVQALKEIDRACSRVMSSPEEQRNALEFVLYMKASLEEIIVRLENRKKCDV